MNDYDIGSACLKFVAFFFLMITTMVVVDTITDGIVEIKKLEIGCQLDDE